MKKVKKFLKENWKTIAIIGLSAISYKIGFDVAYNRQVPYSYRDPSLLRYFTGDSLDIGANGITGSRTRFGLDYEEE